MPNLSRPSSGKRSANATQTAVRRSVGSDPCSRNWTSYLCLGKQIFLMTLLQISSIAASRQRGRDSCSKLRPNLIGSVSGLIPLFLPISSTMSVKYRRQEWCKSAGVHSRQFLGQHKVWVTIKHLMHMTVLVAVNGTMRRRRPSEISGRWVM